MQYLVCITLQFFANEDFLNLKKHTVKLLLNDGSKYTPGSEPCVQINAESQINAGSSGNTELSEYQPYTSYVIATPTLSADTDNSLLFLANQVDIDING